MGFILGRNIILLQASCMSTFMVVFLKFRFLVSNVAAVVLWNFAFCQCLQKGFSMTRQNLLSPQLAVFCILIHLLLFCMPVASGMTFDGMRVSY